MCPQDSYIDGVRTSKTPGTPELIDDQLKYAFKDGIVPREKVTHDKIYPVARHDEFWLDSEHFIAS